MSERQRRWYAPLLTGWRGGPMSRRQALLVGLLTAVGALSWLLSGALDDEQGPVGATIDWLLVAMWSVLAYVHLAHAAFNTTGQTEGPEGGA